MKKKISEVATPEAQETLDEVRVIAEAMMDKKAKDVVSLDLRNIGTSISDYFVICNADSTTQVVAISDNVEEMMEKRCGRPAYRKQGRENAFWVILDYSDIVVHIFKTDQRLFYRLEDLWADAVKTIYEDKD
ncbi:MAG: ribosome silencing factor [Bacteroidales bacterium]|nr:ribosome silencing factor [Bacteroidales bacterium]